MVLQQTILSLLFADPFFHVAVAHRRWRADHAVAAELSELPAPGLRGFSRGRAREIVDEGEAEGGRGDRVRPGVGEALFFDLFILLLLMMTMMMLVVVMLMIVRGGGRAQRRLLLLLLLLLRRRRRQARPREREGFADAHPRASPSSCSTKLLLGGSRGGDGGGGRGHRGDGEEEEDKERKRGQTTGGYLSRAPWRGQATALAATGGAAAALRPAVSPPVAVVHRRRREKRIETPSTRFSAAFLHWNGDKSNVRDGTQRAG